MRVVAMVSGGKDSCYNMMQCAAEGHEIVALANLHPKDKDELDSFMYQTVGHMGIEILAKAMNLPLYRRETKGKSTQTGKQYVPTDDDEVEDLYNLLALCKEELQVDAVAVGAIFSDYQRVRVENVCSRLNLISLAYLWRRDQTELLQEMIECQVHAIIIKVASLGLIPERHLGKSLREMQPHLLKMRDKYGLNVCGEGGEYETFTVDCPLYKQRIVIEDVQTVISSADPICPVGYINFTKLSLQPKDSPPNCDVIVKKSLDYINDLNESTYSDLSDPDLSETELELIEKETRMRESLSQNELTSRRNSFGRSLTNSASSPIPIVTKSASVDDQTSLTMISRTTASSANSAGVFCTNSMGSSTAAVCGSLSIGMSTLALGTKITSNCNTDTQPPSPIKYEREFRPLANQPMAAMNRKGWMWVAGIQGCAETLELGMRNALCLLKEQAKLHNYEMTDYCYITLYVRSISEYPILNRVYSEIFNFHNPPTRVCVECPLPLNCHVIMEAIAYRQPIRQRRTKVAASDNGCDDQNLSKSCDTYSQRHTMHVQGISHWAPANIGPYSQSTKVGEITYISGQIALVPGSMTIIEGGIRPQCKLTLRHISRIAKAMNAQGQLRDVVHGICFVTHPSFIAEARTQWERRTTNAVMDYIVVPALPRNALVEWQVWAHTHNDRFEYEETGCSIGDYTISIRRRWNYENNCAAIVCYVSTGLASSTTQLTKLNDDMLTNHCQLAQNLNLENLDEIFTYIVNRLLKGYPISKHKPEYNNLSNSSNFTLDLCNTNTFIENSLLELESSAQNTRQENGSVLANNSTSSLLLPAIHLKLFYQVTSAPSVDLLLQSLSDFRRKCENTASIVYTVLPACSLHNFSTFLSICGVRHE